MKPICFYHSADLDGVCSGAIVKHFVPDCELAGYDYGQPFPWDKVRPGPDAENDPLWAHLFEPKNGYEGPEQNDGYAVETIRMEKRTVYMVDVSLPPKDMKRLAAVSNLIWIDHHKTAIEGCKELPPTGVQDTRYAACELCWSWFNTGTMRGDGSLVASSLPEVVRLLGRYDVWDKDTPEWDSKIEPFQYGMRAQDGVYNPANEEWTNWLTDAPRDLAPIVANGEAILGFQAQQNQRIAEAGAFEARMLSPRGQATLIERKAEREKHGPAPVDPDAWLGWLGWVAPIEHDIRMLEEKRIEVFRDRGVAPLVLRCICLNTPLFSSQSFDSVYDPEKHDLMVPFAELANGKWKVSLYSTKPEIDCGAIAKTFGGGGHKQAAGFVCDRLPWEG